MRLFVFVIAALFGLTALAQGVDSAPMPAQSTSSVSLTSAVKTTKPTKTEKPAWIDLKPEQQAALAPLQTEWPHISATQKRKWLEVSKNFAKLQADEQTKLHSRMKDWVALSPQQRAQARLNFSSAKTLTPEEKQKQWQAYQALSTADKEKLTAKAKDNTLNSAALANKPQNKTLPVSKLQTSPASAASAPVSAPTTAK